jgi:hypothetical protein
MRTSASTASVSVVFCLLVIAQAKAPSTAPEGDALKIPVFQLVPIDFLVLK